MSSKATPKFYKPVFGNDNFLNANAMNRDIVDIAAFASPAMALDDVALQPLRKSEIL